MGSSNPLPFAFLTQKNPPVKKETRVQSLGREDPLEKEMATSNQILQYSCLGNPMDRGVWWATVHWVIHHLVSKQQQQQMKTQYT